MKPLKTLDQWSPRATTVPTASGFFQVVSDIARQLDIIQLLRSLAKIYSFSSDWPPTLESLGATSLTYTLEATRRTRTHANSEGRVKQSERVGPQSQNYRPVYVHSPPPLSEYRWSSWFSKRTSRNLEPYQHLNLPLLLAVISQQARNTEAMSRDDPPPNVESQEPGPLWANRPDLPYAFGGSEPGALYRRVQAARDLQISPEMVEIFLEEHPQGHQLRFSQAISLILEQNQTQHSPKESIQTPPPTAYTFLGLDANVDQGFETTVQGQPVAQPALGDPVNPGAPAFAPEPTHGLDNEPLMTVPGDGNPPNTAPVATPPTMTEQLEQRLARVRLQDQDPLDHVQQQQQPANQGNEDIHIEGQPRPPRRRVNAPNVSLAPVPPNMATRQAQIRTLDNRDRIPQRRMAPNQGTHNGNIQPRPAPRPRPAQDRHNLNRAPQAPAALQPRHTVPRPQLVPNPRAVERTARPRVVAQPNHAPRPQENNPAREPHAGAGAAPQQPVECLICTEPIQRPLNLHSSQLPCGHVHCHECLANGLRVAIRTMPFSPVRCCQRIDMSILRRTRVATADEIQTYRKKLTELNEDQPLYCHDPKCSDFIPDALRSKNVGKCRKCHKKTCTECRHVFHLGACDSEETAAAPPAPQVTPRAAPRSAPRATPRRRESVQPVSSRALRIQRATNMERQKRDAERAKRRREAMLRAEENAFNRFSAHMGWRRCPRCLIMVEKIEGCNHIHCVKCGTHFCYRCGKAPYGNHGPCAM